MVYLAKNKINGKQYVGYTIKSLEERKKTHLYKSRSKPGKHYFYIFKEAIRKYGFESFEWSVLDDCISLEESCEKEIFYIKKLNTISPNGYNLTEGGNGGVPSDETKKKISISLKKYYKKNKWVDRVSKEVRSQAGKNAWETRRKNNYIPATGFKRSLESRIKMSNTKNEIHKVKWLNVKTNETICLSSTKMAKYCNLSSGTFNHLKKGRQKQTKCGWTLYVEKVEGM